MDDLQAPIIIAVMGVTGSGKSTFIRSLTRDNNINIGNTWHSGTYTFQAASMHIGSRKVILVDTPGFEDTFQNDSEILVELSFWLKTKNLNLSGLIYLHPITEYNISAKSVWNREMMKLLMGVVNLGNVVLVTNRWEEIKSKKQGTEMERALLAPQGFWYNIWIQQNHPGHFRHNGTMQSGFSIINNMVNRAQACVIFRFQAEVVMEERDVIQTGACQMLIERVVSADGKAELRAEARAHISSRYLLFRQALRRDLLEQCQIQSQDPEQGPELESGLSRLCVIQ